MLLGLLCRICRCVVANGRNPTAAAKGDGSEGKTKVGGGDDLTAIRGIGIAKANRLNAGEIRTYERLARSTPEELRKILGSRGQGARVEDWIAEAEDLAGRG